MNQSRVRTLVRTLEKLVKIKVKILEEDLSYHKIHYYS